MRTIALLVSLLLSSLAAHAQTATFVKADTTTGANWQSSYGADGHLIALEPSVLPSYATYAITGDLTWTWASGGSLGETCWYAYPSFTVSVTVSGTHQVSFFAIDYDHQNRSETFTLASPSGTVLDTRQVTNFTGGEYLVYNISGTVNVTITGSWPNAVLSGIFFDTPNAPASYSVLVTWTASASTGVTSYLVKRSTVNAGPYTLIASVPFGVNQYTDSSTAPGLVYYYVVTAIVEQSVNSNQAQVTTP